MSEGNGASLLADLDYFLGLAVRMSLKERADLRRHCSALLWSYGGRQDLSTYFPDVPNY